MKTKNARVNAESDQQEILERAARGRSPIWGASARAHIVYAAQLQRPERPLFADGDLAHATPDEFAAAGSSYIAYSGRFFVDEDKNTLFHEMAVSFFPNWLGQKQMRLVEINGDRLQLSTDGPQRVNGELKTATLTWRRAQPNQDGASSLAKEVRSCTAPETRSL